jgi:uncharacterized protein (TIGR03067 family)
MNRLLSSSESQTNDHLERTMKSKSILQSLALVAGISLAAQSLWAAEVEAGFRSLFNGTDLTGWAGRPQHWSVQDGAITGTTTKETPAKGNNFLIARDGDKDLIVGDFELRCAFKFSGDWGNSGIQYRSQALTNFVVHGYQADMETGPTYSGILYEEGGRGILCERGKKVVIKDDPANPGKPKIEVVGSLGDPKEIGAAIDPRQWNDYVVIAQGNHLQQFINGRQTVDVVDEQATKAAKSGILALQLHAGQPMKIQFKNIRLKELSGGAAGNDLDRWQGTWTPTKMVWNGEPVPAETLARVKLVIAGNRYTLESDQTSEGTVKLDSSASPRALDATTSGGDQVRGIYELGDGTLTICDALGDGPRPKAFKSDPDSETFLAVFRKAGGNDLERAQGRWTPTKMVRNGESVPAGDLAQAKLTIAGNRFSFEGDPPAEGTFKFDSSATPHTVDATASGGEQVHGIYEIKDDTFTLCYGIEDAPRPKAFKAEADSGHVLAVFRKGGGNDLDRVQGRWTPTRMIRNGEAVSADDLAKIKLKIEGNRFTLEADEPAEGTVKLDSSSTPRNLDATASGGEQIHGIYELSDGTFTICYGVEDTPRPKAFKADADSNQVLAVFRKATP